MDTVLTAVATPLMGQPGFMELAIIVLILMIVVVLPIALIVVLLTILRRSSHGASSGQEEQILREMNARFQRMEERIEAAEALAMERGIGKSEDRSE